MLAYLIEGQWKQQYSPCWSMRREATPVKHQVGVLNFHRLKGSTSLVPLLFTAVVKKNTPPLYIKYEDLRRNYPYILISFLETKYNIYSSGERLTGNQIVTRSRADNSARQREKILKQLKSQSKEEKMIDEGQPEPQVKESQQDESLSVSYQSSTEVNLQGIVTSQRSMRKVPDIPRYQKRHYSPPKSKKRMLLDPEFVKQQEQKKKAAKKQAKKKQAVPGPKILDYQQIMKERFGEDYAIYYDYCLFTKEKDIFRAPKEARYHPPKKSANRPKPKKEKPQSGNSQWEKQEPRTQSNKARRYANRK